MLLSKVLKPGETQTREVLNATCPGTRGLQRNKRKVKLLWSIHSYNLFPHQYQFLIKPSSESCVILGTLGGFIIGIYGLCSVFDVINCNEVYFHPTFISVVFFSVFLFLHHFQEEGRKSSQL